MADKTLTVNGQPFTINRDRKAEVSQLSVNGQAFHIDRTAPVIESDPVGNSRPLLDKLVGGAAAAYSLRDLNSKQGDSNVVNVRRSGDNLEKVFQAKDVPSIEDWVNGKQETTLPADVAPSSGAYSLRKVKAGYAEDVVRIRRSSDGVEVDVAFDSDDKVSASSAITNVAEQGGESGQTTATDLNGFLNEDVNVETSDFSSDVDGYSEAVSTHTTLTREASFEGENNVLETARVAGRYGIKKSSVDINNANSYTITFKYYAESAYNNKYLNFGYSFSGAVSPSNYVQITSGSWQTATLTMSAGFSQMGSETVLQIRVSDSDGNVYGTATSGTIYYKDIVVTATESGAFVHTWYDQAGSNDAVQDTASSQPKIAEGGALLTDGVSFDGDFFLQKTTTDTTTAASIFGVHTKGTSVDSGARPIGYQESISSGTNSLAFAMDNTIRFDGTSASGASQTIPTSGLFLSTTIKVSNTEAKHFLNSVSNITNSSLTLNDTDVRFTLGHSSTTPNYEFDGNIKEAIFYTSDQSDNRFKIESNINNYYGLYNDEKEFSADAQVSGTGSTVSNASRTGGTLTLGAGASGTNHLYFQLQNLIPAGTSAVYVSFNFKSSDNSVALSTLKTRDNGFGPRSGNLLDNDDNTITVQNNGFYSGALKSFSTSGSTRLSFATGHTTEGYTFTVSDLKFSFVSRDGFVEVLYDQSGNGRDMTQANESYQPKLVSNGSICKTNNGYSSILFDGSDDFLSTNTYEPADEPNGMTDFNLVCVTGRPPTQTQRVVASAGSQEGSHVIGGFYFSNNVTNGQPTKQDIRFNISEHDASPHIDQKIVTATPLQDTNLMSFNRVGSDNTFESFTMAGTKLTGTSLVPKTGQSAAAGAAFKIGASMYHSVGRKHYLGQILEVVFYDSNNRNNAVAINHNIKNQYQI